MLLLIFLVPLVFSRHHLVEHNNATCYIEPDVMIMTGPNGYNVTNTGLCVVSKCDGIDGGCMYINLCQSDDPCFFAECDKVTHTCFRGYTCAESCECPNGIPSVFIPTEPPCHEELILEEEEDEITVEEKEEDKTAMTIFILVVSAATWATCIFMYFKGSGDTRRENGHPIQIIHENRDQEDDLCIK